MIKVSIVIPSYNQQQYLPHAIESALEQKAHEVIVVDDGSTDQSLLVARAYEKQGVKVISQVNKGLSAARNTGVMNATGDYILPLDADDILLEGCVDKIKAKIEETNADIIGLSFKVFGTNTGELVLMENPTIEDFKTGNRLAYCSAIRRDALLECGGYSSRMVWGYEDLHLWFDLLTRGKKIAVITEFCFLYRTKEHSMIHDAVAHHDELMAQINKDFKL